MTLPQLDVRKGKQEPRVEVLPRGLGDGEAARFAAALFADLDVQLYPWEQRVLNGWLAKDEETDAPLYTRCGLSVPRQNGKTLIVEALELYLLAVEGAHILHTAHRVKTSKKAFGRMSRFFGKGTALQSQLVEIRRTNGEETIRLANGGVIEYLSRSRSVARGFDDIGLVVFDEAQELTDSQLEAIMFTLSASATGERQMVYMGTPPDSECHGTVFPRMRQKIIDGDDTTAAWHEWSVEKLPDATATFDDVRDAVYAANPSMGYILSEDFTREEFAGATVDGFARERLGWWSSVDVNLAFHPDKWAHMATLTPPHGRKLAYGVKFSPDGEVVSLAVAMSDENDKSYLEVIEHRSLADGSSWLSDWLAERWRETAAIVVDGLAGAFALCGALADKGVPRRLIYEPRTTTMTKAASLVMEAFQSEALTHFDQPLLNDSIGGARKRPIGHNGAFGFMSESADVTPLEACALALYGLKTSKRDPTKKQRIIR